MSTRAKATFDINIQRASYFLDIHDDAHKRAGAPTLPYRELPRGTVVFAVGAIDAYLSEASAEYLVARLQLSAPVHDLRETLKRVCAEVPTLALEVALLPGPQDRLQRIRDSIVDHFHNSVSNQAKGVAATLQRIGSRPGDFWTSLVAEGYKDPASELDRWTEVRHQIVHRGQRPPIQKPSARSFLSLAKALVDRLDVLVQTATATPAV